MGKVVCFSSSADFSRICRSFVYYIVLNTTLDSVGTEEPPHLPKGKRNMSHIYGILQINKKQEKRCAFFFYTAFWKRRPIVVIRSFLTDGWGDPTQ